MSREIKFRAWNKKYKRMYKVLHLHYDSKEQIWVTVEGWSVPEDKPIHVDIQPKDCIVMQFTGIYDKNETPIYEGDIIKGPNSKLWVIKWYRFSFCINNFDIISEGLNKFGGNEQYPLETYLNFLPRELMLIEVIGNIYSNPELLQNK